MGISAHTGIIEQYKQGDQRAFSSIFQQLYPVMFIFASRIMKDTEMAEDVLQEAFYKMYKIRERVNVQTMEEFKAYLYTVVSRDCMQSLAGRAKELGNIMELRHHVPVAEDPAIFRDEITAGIFHKIRMEVAKMPELEQRIFQLAFIEGIPNRQISEELHIAYQTVANVKSKILAALRLSELSLTLHLAVMLYHSGGHFI